MGRLHVFEIHYYFSQILLHLGVYRILFLGPTLSVLSENTNSAAVYEHYSFTASLN